MSFRVFDVDIRIAILSRCLGEESERQAIHSEFGGDIHAALERLRKILPEESHQRLTLANTLAEWAEDHAPMVERLVELPYIQDLRDVALHFDADGLAPLIDPDHLHESAPGDGAEDKREQYAATLQAKLFDSQRSAVLQRMVSGGQIEVGDEAIRPYVAGFFAALPKFDIRTTSVLTALKDPEVLKDVPADHYPAVVEKLKALQRVQAISPTAEAAATLVRRNLTSAYHIAEKSESTFLRSHGEALGEEVARQVYTRALDVRIRNEHALMTLRETTWGSGIAAVDGPSTRQERRLEFDEIARRAELPIDFESLFGSQDVCECEECTSIYSPAAYFVELLQYLRNNDLDPDAKGPTAIKKADPKDISGTPLEILLRRRPDLGCLELTCANTHTALPYIDLANEVMESFIFHLADYAKDKHTPKQAKIEAYNVEDETTGELMAQPQHIRDEVYDVLRTAVYPFTLPYDQAVDSTRLSLGSLGSSRVEIEDAFRSAYAPTSAFMATHTPAERHEYGVLHGTIQDRAVEAESLGLTQEEYVILTKEGFSPKRRFDLEEHAPLTPDEYRTKIRGKSVAAYYGYSHDAAGQAQALNASESARQGLTFVKGQFLPRTGIQYVDLVALLETQSINPNMPRGRARAIMDGIAFSYRYLQTLVDTAATTPSLRFKKLIDFLQSDQNLAPGLAPQESPCEAAEPGPGLKKDELADWVAHYFDRIGKVIVLETGEGAHLPATEKPNARRSPADEIMLKPDGKVVDGSGLTVGFVDPTGRFNPTGTAKTRLDKPVVVVDDHGRDVGFLRDKAIYGPFKPGSPATWVPPIDTCDLGKIRLVHLDGTPVDLAEYDRIHRVIRLWRKLDWTIDEVDQALVAITRAASSATVLDVQITPGLLHQSVAIRKVQERTGLALPKLLALWGDIGTAGKKSLYETLFLTHNVRAIDPVFKADDHGNYLTQADTISTHVPVLMAALGLRADGLAAIRDFASLNDDLTIENVSALYRFRLLASLLRVKIADLFVAIRLFGDPFADPAATLEFLEAWDRTKEAGFSLRQVEYAVLGGDNPDRPLAPSLQTVLRAGKALFDGLNAIRRDHPDLGAGDSAAATADRVRAEAGLLFDPPVVERIVSLLEGTTLYATNAPPGLDLPSIKALPPKVRYVAPSASLQTTGILTASERSSAESLWTDPGWAPAFARIAKQADRFFDDVLAGVLDEPDTAKAALLQGDGPDSAPDKRLLFLQRLMPFLRRRLSDRLVIDTVAGALHLSAEVATALLADVLEIGAPGPSALEALKAIVDAPSTGGPGWKGYLVPPADGDYTLLIVSNAATAPSIQIDGRDVGFPYQQDDPNNVFSGDPIPLMAGKPVLLETPGDPFQILSWRTATMPPTAIPTTALLPDHATAATRVVFEKLAKAAILANGLALGADEIVHLQRHGSEFGGLDFNAPTMPAWRRLQAYSALRDRLPSKEASLLDLFRWASGAPAAADLVGKIVSTTSWDKVRVASLISRTHLNLIAPGAFRNEIGLLAMERALAVADRVGVEIGRLFRWALPEPDGGARKEVAKDVRDAIRARVDQTEWEERVKPLNDALREAQQRALVAYLLVQPEIVAEGVTDADGLSEFLLMEVRMGSCLKTSRIGQAISTVQLFVLRHFLGQETQVPLGALDRERWDAGLRHQPTHAAAKQAFTYPENILLPALRDDKSPFYKELESALLQNDVTTETIKDALHNYMHQVDGVANLKVVGLFQDDEKKKLYVFSRTRNAPHFFYHRLYDISSKNWYPWEKVQVDIPSYDREYDGHVIDHGTYLSPVVWNGRLMIFFPVFSKKTKPATLYRVVKKLAKDPKDPPEEMPRVVASALEASGVRPEYLRNSESWEIKLGWSELRNGKWQPKQISTDLHIHSEERYVPPTTVHPTTTVDNVSPDQIFSVDYVVEATDAPAISGYAFVPRITSTGKRLLGIDVYAGYDLLVSFLIKDSQPEIGDDQAPGILHYSSGWHYSSFRIKSLQASESSDPDKLLSGPSFEDFAGIATAYLSTSTSMPFRHPFVHDLLGELSTAGMDGVYKLYQNGDNEQKLFQDPSDPGKFDLDDAYGADPLAGYHELKRAYSIYNWEPAHAAMQIMQSALTAGQFDLVLRCAHLALFDPHSKDPGPNRVWKFPPFKKIDATNVLEKLFNSLQPNAPDTMNAINEWRDKPFRPHVVARARPSAYMKWIAMTYVRTLIEQGDSHFRKPSLAAIPTATQFYVTASHLLGRGEESIPRRGKVRPQTYLSLLDKWDAFGNAMVQLEVAAPFSVQTSQPAGGSNATVGLANIFGSATTHYFCIPENPQIRALRETIDDRLFKIRRCQDIDGAFRELPLFDQAIDPRLLAEATAQGLSLESVLNDLEAPMPNYRFYYLLQKAIDMCGQVNSLDAMHLSTKEKWDGERLSVMQATHEITLQSLIMEVRQTQRDQANQALVALEQSRLGPVSRLQHYLRLIGEDLKKVPDSESFYNEIEAPIESPVDEGGLKLTSYEKLEMDKADEAADWQNAIGAIETLASSTHLYPEFEAAGKPLGIGIGVVTGGLSLGNALQATARGMQTYASHLSFQSSQAARKGGFQRQLQDRILQANAAGFEIKNIDRQILTQKIAVDIATKEMACQQTQVDQRKETHAFLRGKVTNEELYEWMDGNLKTLRYQAYKLAYSHAKKAQQAFRFERGPDTPNFIQFGYWEAGRDGMFAGERLHLALKQMEAAYQEKRGHDFEIVKTVSLRQLDPQALLLLREEGACEFSIPEAWFDMDYPGHTMRRIKSVAVTMPCVVGPYTSLNCTVRLLRHKYRTSPSLGSGYAERTDGSEDRFHTVNVPISAIAVSGGQNDSGVFELNFHDERYIPFEGAGAIGKWRIELSDFQQFDRATLTDVALQIRYTSLEAGQKLKEAASRSAINFVKSDATGEGLSALFDLRHDFPNEWHKATQTNKVVTLDNLAARLPYFTANAPKGESHWKPFTVSVGPLAYNLTGSLSEGGDLSGSGTIDFGPGPMPANAFIVVKYKLG